MTILPYLLVFLTGLFLGFIAAILLVMSSDNDA